MPFQKIVCLFLLFYFVFQASAQNRFNLEQCIEYAYKQSFSVKQQLLKIKQAENTLHQSKQATYPNLSGVISQGINSGRSIDPFTNDFIQHTIASNAISFGSNLILFNGFALKNQNLQNSLDLQADEWDLQKVKNELRNQITLAYMNVLMSEELLKISQEQVSSLQLQLDRMKELVKEGKMPDTDLIDLDAQLAMAEFESLSMKSNIELGKSALTQLMGYPGYNLFEIELISFDENNVIVDQSYLKEILDTIDEHPVVKNADLRFLSSGVGIKIAQAAKYPGISLGAGVGTAYSSAAPSEYNYFNQLNFNLNQYVRININIPIYSNGQIKARINSAVINRQIAETHLLQSRQQLKAEVEQAYLIARIARGKLTSASRQLNAQRLAFDSAKERFLEGLIHAIELNSFRLNLEKANSNFIQAKYELLFRKMILDYYR